MKYLAVNFGIVSAIAAAIAYMASVAPDIRRALFWKDHIHVASFSTLGSLQIVNDGDGPLLITGIAYNADLVKEIGTGQTGLIQINKVVESGAVLTHDLRTRDDKVPTVHRKYVVAADESREMWRLRLRDSGDPYDFQEGRKCNFRVLAHQDDDSTMLFMAGIGEHFQTYKVEAEVLTYSIKSRKVLAFPLHAIGFLAGEKGCKPRVEQESEKK